MGRQESPQLIERKTQVDTDAQETSRASKYSDSFESVLWNNIAFGVNGWKILLRNMFYWHFVVLTLN